MMAEIFGKKTGYCKGKGGSMHIADFSVGMLGANGVVGGGFTMVTGAGLAQKMQKTDGVSVFFFGDGASNRGTFHEAINMAAVWKLPVLFVCENNQFASTTPYRNNHLGRRHRGPGAGVRNPGVIVDGNDVFAVYEAAGDLIERRDGEKARPSWKRKPTGSRDTSSATRRNTGRKKKSRTSSMPPTRSRHSKRKFSKRRHDAGRPRCDESGSGQDNRRSDRIRAAIPEPDASELYTDLYVPAPAGAETR
jgi:pyruvate dehydrogenase E1 component alpha subunit